MREDYDEPHSLVGGVDPGKKGGLVVLTETGTIYAAAHVPLLPPKKGTTKRQPAFDIMRKEWGPLIRTCRHVFIERVWGAAPQGRKQGGAGMFNFGYIAGFILGMVEAYEIPYTLILPQKWKQSVGLINADKKASIHLAREMWEDDRNLFARSSVDEGVAEAALIAHVGQGILSAT